MISSRDTRVNLHPFRASSPGRRALRLQFLMTRPVILCTNAVTRLLRFSLRREILKGKHSVLLGSSPASDGLLGQLSSSLVGFPMPICYSIRLLYIVHQNYKRSTHRPRLPLGSARRLFLRATRSKVESLDVDSTGNPSLRHCRGNKPMSGGRWGDT